tara:strand:+ start:8367 stop:8636 length:270 start_codon:yes stop_codon:yes gene_type:complete
MTTQGRVSLNDFTVPEGTVHDNQILLEIEKTIFVSGYAGTLRAIHVEVHRGSVILSGILPSYYLKQIVQVSAMKVDGVVQVSNEIQVDQ